MYIKYSIIIPTRNGMKYLPFCLQTILSQKENNFELIVSDNHSSDGTWNYLNSLKDHRLKIIQPQTPLSMVKHFEYILTQPVGEWISVLGDDDGLQPYFFDIAEKLTVEYSLYEVIGSRRAYYFWPGCEAIYGDIVLSYGSQSKFEIRNSKKQLWKLIFGEGLYFNEPQFYTGTIFKNSLLRRIRSAQEGFLFNSITPDANSVALILKYCDYFVYSEVPFSWIGSSPKSTGFSGSIDIKSDNNNSSSEDFIKLNSTGDIRSNPEFKNVIELFNVKIFFLEAFAQSNLLYRPLFTRILNFFPLKYFSFSTLYPIFIEKQKSNPKVGDLYIDLFRTHGLSIAMLKVFYLSSLYSKIVWNSIRRLVNTAPQDDSISIDSNDHKEFPTIIDACAASLDIYNKLKNELVQ